MKPVFRIHDGTGDFFRPGSSDHCGNTLALRPDQHFVVSRNDRIPFNLYVRPLRFVRDGQAKLGFPGTFSELPPFVVEPVLPLAPDQTGVVDQVAVEVRRIIAVLQGRVRGEALPGAVG